MSRYDADKNDFMRFVNSVRWHCAIAMKTTKLKEDINRAVRGVYDIRPDCTKMQFCNRIFKIDDFNGLATLFERLDKSGKVSFN